jgi:hypothetical protein
MSSLLKVKDILRNRCLWSLRLQTDMTACVSFRCGGATSKWDRYYNVHIGLLFYSVLDVYLPAMVLSQSPYPSTTEGFLRRCIISMIIHRLLACIRSHYAVAVTMFREMPYRLAVMMVFKSSRIIDPIPQQLTTRFLHHLNNPILGVLDSRSTYSFRL